MDIKKELSNLYEPDFAAFQRRLIPNIDPERIHGVRTPYARALAKKLVKDPDCETFLSDLPHGSFEEDQLHVFVINATRPFELCLERLERFLPYVNNWATSDQISPNVFKKSRNGYCRRSKNGCQATIRTRCVTVCRCICSTSVTSVFVPNSPNAWRRSVRTSITSI